MRLKNFIFPLFAAAVLSFQPGFPATAEDQPEKTSEEAKAIPKDLPDDARAVIAEYQSSRDAIMKKADDELKAFMDKMLADLQSLQEKYANSGEAGSAAAIRDAAESIRGGEPVSSAKEAVKPVEKIYEDPYTLKEFRFDGNVPPKPGDTALFRIKGAIEGSVWGADIYTTDSVLAVAAVHAGVIKDGEEGVIRVIFEPGQKNYRRAVRREVKSEEWGSFPMSFRVEAVKR